MKKWKKYFAAFGCVACGRKDVAHKQGGFCAECLALVQRRFADIARQVRP